METKGRKLQLYVDLKQSLKANAKVKYLIPLAFGMLLLSGYLPESISWSVLQLALALLFNYFYLAIKELGTKTVALWITIYAWVVFITDPFALYIDFPLWYRAVEIMVITLITFHKAAHLRLGTGDAYNPANVMLCFHTPRDIIGRIKSVIGLNVGTMSIVAGNDWFKFTLKSKSLIKRSFDTKIKSGEYLLMDTGVKADEYRRSLNMLIGFPARSIGSLGLRFNCVRAFKPILNSIGGVGRYRIGDVFPSLFLLRRINYKTPLEI